MSKLVSGLAKVRALGVFDIAWVVGFACCVTLLLMRPGVSATAGKGVALELATGGQRRGIYHGASRVGEVLERVARRGQGWLVTQKFLLASESKPIGTITLRLYRDLSLERVDIEADLSKLPLFGGAGAGAGAAATAAAKAAAKAAQHKVREKLGKTLGDTLSRALPLLQRMIGGVGKIKIGGTCETHRGSCWLRGRVGDRPFGREVTVGRGPVLTSAIFPLLARGALGRTAELSIFDPLALSTRLVTFRVGKREKITLRSGETRGLRVEQDAGLLGSTVWLDSRGHVLLETLAGGLRVEHEAWLP